MKWKCPYVLRNFVGRDTICLRKLQLSRFTIDGAKLMKQKIVARQYVPCHWDGRPSMPVSKNQCKRASKVPREPLMLKSIYLLEKQSNVRDRLSIVCKCMRTPPPLLLVVVCLYIACLWINAQGIYCDRRWRLWLSCWMPLYPCIKSCVGKTLRNEMPSVRYVDVSNILFV